MGGDHEALGYHLTTEQVEARDEREVTDVVTTEIYA